MNHVSVLEDRSHVAGCHIRIVDFHDRFMQVGIETGTERVDPMHPAFLQSIRQYPFRGSDTGDEDRLCRSCGSFTNLFEGSPEVVLNHQHSDGEGRNREASVVFRRALHSLAEIFRLRQSAL